MTQRAGRAVPGPVPRSAADSTMVLLICGAAAGPLLVVVTTIEILTRSGFDLWRHGISLLSLGDRGWIQVANFVVAGLLSLAFAVGVRRVLRPGIGSLVGPALICGYGAGLAATGGFLVDPGLGFPPGAPSGIPVLSWHGAIHAVAPPAAFVCLVGVCLVFALRFADRGRWGWVLYSCLTGLTALALICWPGQGGSVRSAAAVLATATWMTLVAAGLVGEWAARVDSAPA